MIDALPCFCWFLDTEPFFGPKSQCTAAGGQVGTSSYQAAVAPYLITMSRVPPTHDGTTFKRIEKVNVNNKCRIEAETEGCVPRQPFSPDTTEFVQERMSSNARRIPSSDARERDFVLKLSILIVLNEIRSTSDPRSELRASLIVYHAIRAVSYTILQLKPMLCIARRRASVLGMKARQLTLNFSIPSAAQPEGTKGFHANHDCCLNSARLDCIGPIVAGGR